MRRISLIMIIVAALTVTSILYVRGQAPRPTAQTPEATSLTTPPEKSVKRVQVTAQTIANLPAGKPLVIDLTRTGTIYELAAGIDYSRVRVRTSTGEKAMSDLVKRLGIKQLGTSATLGMSSDGMFTPPVRGTSRTTAAGISQYDCHFENKCDCTGFSDCLKLQLDGWCKGEWYCNGPHHSECYCMKRKG